MERQSRRKYYQKNHPKPYPFRMISIKLLGRYPLAGPRFFKYTGEWLNDIRHRLEQQEQLYYIGDNTKFITAFSRELAYRIVCQAPPS